MDEAHRAAERCLEENPAAAGEAHYGARRSTGFAEALGGRRRRTATRAARAGAATRTRPAETGWGDGPRAAIEETAEAGDPGTRTVLLVMSGRAIPASGRGCCLPMSRSWLALTICRQRSGVAWSSSRSPGPRRSRSPRRDGRARARLVELAAGHYQAALASLRRADERGGLRPLRERPGARADRARLQEPRRRGQRAPGAGSRQGTFGGWARPPTSPGSRDHLDATAPATGMSSPSASSRSCACSPRGNQPGDRRGSGR